MTGEDRRSILGIWEGQHVKRGGTQKEAIKWQQNNGNAKTLARAKEHREYFKALLIGGGGFRRERVSSSRGMFLAIGFTGRFMGGGDQC